MKKWIIRISLGLFACLFLIVTALFFLLGTQSGTNFIVSQAEKQLDGQLRIASATGTLLDRLEINDLLFDGLAGKAELGRLVLDWKSSDLFSLHFHIVELSADNLIYTAIPQATAEEPEIKDPISLPDLSLPIRITIEKLAVNNLTFFADVDAEPLTVNHTSIALLWDTTGIQLQELSFSMPEVALQAKGQILPTGHYPLTFETDIQTLSPDYPSVTVHGEYHGDLQKLTITEELRGEIEADIHASLQNVLNDLAWNIDLQITKLTPKTFSPVAPANVSGKITSNGNLQQLAATAQIRVRDEIDYFNWDAVLDMDVNLESLLVKINKCTLKHLDTVAVLELSGTADMEQQLDIALQWQELQWPVSGEAEYSSAAGDISLTGTMDDFQLILETAVSGNAIPETVIQLTTDGNRESVRDIQLTLSTLEGKLIISGDAAWAPTVTWEVNTEAQHLNPGVYFAQWPGEIDWLIKSDGQMKESGVFANVIIDRLQGNLREYPIAGKGVINIADETIQIDKLLLSSGDATIDAQGTLGATSDLKWNIHIPDFADLLPDSSGKLSASGSVLGKMTAPKLGVEIIGNSIVLPQGEMQKLQLHADLDLSWEEAFTIDLLAKNLKSGENLIPELTLQAEGLLTKHTLNLFASHELAELSLNLAGGYENEQWQGTLESLLLDTKDMGNWQSKKAVKIKAGSEAATLEQLCLHRETSNLCVNGNWDKENNNTGGKISLTGFPVNWLAAWFPVSLESLGGEFSFEAEATMQDKLSATAQAQITPGKINYITDKNQGTLSHEGLKLDLLIADNGLDADLWLSVDSNIVSGKLKSPNLLKTEQEQSPTIDGQISIDAKNFALVETLIADVQNLQAEIDADFSIQGTLAQPNLNGAGKLNINNILIPVAGLELSDTSLDLLADNSNLKINGIFNSPKGSMAINGHALLDAEKNYPARITLKGKNFRLINLPDIQIYLTSDLLIERNKELTTLSGAITIPKAEILLRELPTGTTTASPDIVIMQEKKEEEPKAPMRMDLKVTLGKKVHFAGLGVNAFIDGQLSITAEPEEQMLGSGEFHINQGSYRAYGQDLQVETGVISFPGGPLTQPGINLRATRTVGDIVAGISVIGPASKPRITTFSHPPMSESLTISYLITGSAPNAGEGTTLSVGRQINNKLNVSVGTNTKTGDSEFAARYQLSRKFFVQTTTATSSNAVDIFYTTEFGGEEKKEEE